MPSPFPGMDPFLELPDMFPGLHISLITHLMGTLQRTLPAPYYAKSGERIFLTAPRREIIPDVDVRHHPSKTGNGRFETDLGTATAVLQRPPVRITVPSVEVTEPFLDVFLKRPKGARLVTSIEILSPTNKALAGQGRKKYLSKQKDVLRRRVHLVEIDLLRGGQHTTAVQRDCLLEQTDAFDYHVFVSQWQEREDFLVYHWQLQQSLPKIAIPLMPDVTPVTIDLQAVFDRAYEDGPYQREVDYRDLRQLDPALTAEQTAWTKALLKKRGLLGKRPSS